MSSLIWRFATTAIVSLWYEHDDHAEKIERLSDMLTREYGAYLTGPTTMHVPGNPNMLSFGFRHQQDIDKASRILPFCQELRAAPPMYIGPQPSSRR